MQGMGLGSNAMHVLTPRLNTFISVQLGWGFSVALAAWTCFGVTGLCMITSIYRLSVYSQPQPNMNGMRRDVVQAQAYKLRAKRYLCAIGTGAAPGQTRRLCCPNYATYSQYHQSARSSSVEHGSTQEKCQSLSISDIHNLDGARSDTAVIVNVNVTIRQIAATSYSISIVTVCLSSTVCEMFNVQNSVHLTFAWVSKVTENGTIRWIIQDMLSVCHCKYNSILYHFRFICR